ncbi:MULTISPECIES: DUF3617 domain-containing protein [Sphingomonadales]|nr:MULTISPECIES: hypothetical protein [Sphingomonas]MDX3884462.1 hypothetical protein [Sphingomonas sp.]OHT20542.1 hypothetical protein BHE75_02540 [Sphingomonas haloaromaticamans]
MLTIASPFIAVPAAYAAPQPLVAGGMLEPGLWRLQPEGEAPRNVCVADAGTLVQLRHPGAPCSRLVIDNRRTSATVHYSCPGSGWGRTTLKLLTPRSATIDTQGIAGNAPFSFTADAQRMGDCPTKSASLDPGLNRRITRR